jgi:hypothetical protein
MYIVVLRHPILGERTLTANASALPSSFSNWIVMDAKAATKELNEAPEFYKPIPNKEKLKPHWELSLNNPVKIMSRTIVLLV